MRKPEKTRSQESHLPFDLFIGQVARMAEFIDRLRLQIKEQHIAAKDQHIANLERFIRNLTKEIVKIKKYSVFYNLLSRFRREILMWLGKIRK